MTETLFIRDCPVCCSSLSIALDKMDDTLTMRPENLPPLAKDRVQIVNTYKQLKGLGSSWQKSHGARGMIYAGQLLDAVGVHGGQLDRAIALLTWLKDQGKDFSLDTAPSFYGEYQAYEKRRIEAITPKCRLCFGVDKTGTGLCPDHQFCWTCRDEVKPPYNWIAGYANCEKCAAEMGEK